MSENVWPPLMRWRLPRIQHSRSITKKPIVWNNTAGQWLGFAGWRWSIQFRTSTPRYQSQEVDPDD